MTAGLAFARAQTGNQSDSCMSSAGIGVTSLVGHGGLRRKDCYGRTDRQEWASHGTALSSNDLGRGLGVTFFLLFFDFLGFSFLPYLCEPDTTHDPKHRFTDTSPTLQLTVTREVFFQSRYTTLCEENSYAAFQPFGFSCAHACVLSMLT